MGLCEQNILHNVHKLSAIDIFIQKCETVGDEGVISEGEKSSSQVAPIHGRKKGLRCFVSLKLLIHVARLVSPFSFTTNTTLLMHRFSKLK